MTDGAKTACVIGSGFGGLALAIRLQAAGVQTTLVEARDKPGGRAYYWERDGFTFDAGPTVITDPACLRELWALTGHDMAEDVELMPVMPFYRLNWPDGTNFDYSNDDKALRAEIARVAPGDQEGYEQFLNYAAGVYEEGYLKLGTVPFLDFTAMIKAAPALARYQAWRSVYSIVSGYVKSEKLREALSFHTLLVGGNPMTTSAIYALIHKLEKDGGVWWAKGGTNRLVAGMVRQFERIGGTVRLHDPVLRVHTLGDRATEVECQSGWQQRFDAVASNADIGYATFGGVSVGANDTLVMYTYGGDANLDGAINGDDYFQIDSGFPEGSHGWFSGDFNYDGAITGDDYFVIDSNFPAQGAPYPTGAGLPGVRAVPEPANLAVCAAAAAASLILRRRAGPRIR